MSIDKKLEERKSNYGNYGDGRKLNVSIMESIDQYHNNLRGVWLTPLEKIMINDIVTKLCRIAATPDHLDSWEDIEGYAKRISEYLEGLQNAIKPESEGQEIASNTAYGQSARNKASGAPEFHTSISASQPIKGRDARLRDSIRFSNMGAAPTK